MTRNAALALVFAVGLVAALALGIRTPASASGGSDEGPDARPGVTLPPGYQLSAGSLLAVSGPSSTVYFNPQDSDDTNTVLFIYNTSATAGAVDFTGFSNSGSTTLNQSLAIPANSMIRISADALTASPAPPTSWADTVIVNFTDTTYYARMTLSAGLKADGWVSWTNGSVFNPRASVSTVPLRFVSDSSLVFLPSGVSP
jgi:hypothetical protein